MQVTGQWALGLCLALLNCMLSSTGFILQRKAHLLTKQLAPEEQPRLHPVWLVGVILYILAAVPDVIAYTLVPQVVCTTIACFRLVVVTVLAQVVLKERIHVQEALGMALCSLGTGLCLAFGPRPDKLPSTAAAAGQFSHTAVAYYLAVGLAVLATLLVLEHADDLGLCEDNTKLHVFTLPSATGLAFALEKVFNTEMGFLDTPENLPWGFVEDPLWASMACAVGSLGLLDFYLNVRGAKRMPVQVFIPTSFALATSLQFFQSLAIFSEFQELDTLHAGISISGAVVSLVGAVCIRPPRVAGCCQACLESSSSNASDAEDESSTGSS